jgi:hypothetical protein
MADRLNIKTTQCDAKAKESKEAGISQNYGLQQFESPRFKKSFSTSRKKDLDISVAFINSPKRPGSVVQGLDTLPDAGLQIDLTVNLNKGSTSKQKSLKRLATSKEKKQPAGILKKIQEETTNPNHPAMEYLQERAPKLINTEGKKLAIKNPEAKQNKAKVIKVGKIQKKKTLNLVVEETPISYYYHNYYLKTIFRHEDSKLPNDYGKTTERGFNVQKSKLADHFSPETKGDSLKVQSNALDDDSWGDSEYEFGDSPKESIGKTPGNKNHGANDMNGLKVLEPETREG